MLPMDEKRPFALLHEQDCMGWKARKKSNRSSRAPLLILPNKAKSICCRVTDRNDVARGPEEHSQAQVVLPTPCKIY